MRADAAAGRASRAGVLATLGLLVAAALAGCGSRVGSDASAAVTPSVAPSLAPTTQPPLATNSLVAAPPTAPTTTATTVAPSEPPSTSAPASTRPVASSVPPTLDPDVTTSTVAVPPTTSANAKAAFCAASKVYAIDDLLVLGGHVVGDATGLLAAYETMVSSAPPELAEPVRALGPITRQAVDLVRSGQITTPAQLQQWLADTAPRADLEQWVRAQQTIVPAMKAICA